MQTAQKTNIGAVIALMHLLAPVALQQVILQGIKEKGVRHA